MTTWRLRNDLFRSQYRLVGSGIMGGAAMDLLMLYFLNPIFEGERTDLLKQGQDDRALVTNDDDAATELGLVLGEKNTDCN